VERTNGAGTVQAATSFYFEFDFDEWAALARSNPSEFEARRQALLDGFLQQFSDADQRRLRGLQFRIDMERRRARTPMAGCIRLSSMMWDSVVGPNGLRNALNRFLAFYPEHPAPAKRPLSSAYTARIIPFHNSSR
jgi:hypothetical protein